MRDSGRVVRGFGAVGCALVVAGCSALPTRELSLSHEAARGLVRREVPPPSKVGFAPANATPAQRAATLDRIWRVVEDDYYDPTFATIDLPAIEARSRVALAGVRSDADFYRVLRDNVGALPDSHSGVLTPRQAEDERTQRTTLMGLSYQLVEGRVVIVGVIPGFPAADAGVGPGMLLEAIDDQPIDGAFLARVATTAAAVPRAPADADPFDPPVAQLTAVADLLSTADDRPSEHRLTLRRADDTLLQVTLRPREGDLPTDEHLTLRPSGVAVLRLSRFDPSATPALVRDLDAANRASRALIIDLRDNPGGELDTARQLIERFIDRRMVLGTLAWRVWRFPITFNVWGDPVAAPYAKPLAILIDGGTASSSELVAHALVELRDAIAVGEPSCGCVVGLGNEFVLPDGGVLRVAELGFRSARGRRMEGDPLVPAIDVAPTLAECRANVDAVLEAAERALLAR